MYKIFIVMSLALVACGDAPKKSSSKFSSNNTTSNNTSNNTTNNGTTTNVVVNPNNVTNNTSNNAPNNVVNNSTNNVSTNNNPNNVVDPVTQKCIDYCDLTVGSCVTDNCSLVTAAESIRQEAQANCLGSGTDSCASRYRRDLTFRELVDNAPVGDCFDTAFEQGRCVSFGFDACNCPLPVLGETCTSDNQCDAGYLQARCFTPALGGPTGGECLAFGCVVGPDTAVGSVVKGDGTGCGPTNLCAVADATQTYCLKGCTSNSQCRDGYTCRLELEFPDGTYGFCAAPAEVP